MSGITSEGNPPVTGRFPSQRASDAGICYVHCFGVMNPLKLCSLFWCDESFEIKGRMVVI